MMNALPPILLDAALKSVLVLALAWLAASAMRRSSAAARHLVWFLAVAALPLLPVLSWALPGWHVLPGWLETRPIASTVVAQTAQPAVLPQQLATQEPAIISPTTTEPPQLFQPAISSPSPKQISQAEPREIRATAIPVQQPPVPKRPAAPIDFWRWAISAWAVLALLALAPAGLGTLSLWRLERGARRENEPGWLQLLQRLVERLGFRRRVKLLKSTRRRMPMTWGVLRPRLLLPEESRDWPEERRRVVLLHELAHAKRLDYLTNLVTQLACAMYWFNPLVWLAARRLAAERERACDDIVLNHGAKPADYAEQILEIAAGLPVGRFAAHGGIPMARPSGLEGRLRAILDNTRNRAALSRVVMLAMLAALALVVVPVAMLKAAAPETAAKASVASTGTQSIDLGPTVVSTNGVQFGMGFIPERPEITLGEPVYVTFNFTNTGNGPVYLEVGGDYRGVRPMRYNFKALDSQGNAAPDPNIDNIGFGGGVSFGPPPIAPGGIYSEKLYLPLWVKFEKPNEYTVTGSRVIELSMQPRGPAPNSVLNQRFTNSFKLVVLPADTNRLGQRVQELAAALVGADADAHGRIVRQLADIDDPRVAPPLLAVVARGLEGNDGALSTAVSGIAKYPSPEVFAAVEKAMSYPKDDFVRARATEAMANMKSDEAVGLIAKALDDKDQNISYAAATSLGKMGNRLGVEPLKKHMTDPSMYVRMACVEALKALGEPFHADWVVPIIKSKAPNEFQTAAWFVRRNAGSNAAALLIECLDMKNPSVTNYYNYTLVWQIGACGGPNLAYHFDFTKEGTSEQIEENAQILKTLQDWLRAQPRSVPGPGGSQGISPNDPTTGIIAAVAVPSPTPQSPGFLPTTNSPPVKATNQVPRDAASNTSQSGWGEAVEGISVRLAAVKTSWPAGDPPALTASVRNQGSGPSNVGRDQQLAQLEVDGVWYAWMDVDVMEGPLAAGQTETNIQVTLGNEWGTLFTSPDGGKPLKLQPGKHTVRLGLRLQQAGENRVRPISNPVEIEITAPTNPPAASTTNSTPQTTTNALQSGFGDYGVPVYPAKEGIFVRLAAKRTSWSSDETPAFVAALQYPGVASLPLLPQGVELEWDGMWYSWQPLHVGGLSTPPIWEDELGTVPLGREWMAEERGPGNGHLNFTPGTHKIRFAAHAINMDLSGGVDNSGVSTSTTLLPTKGTNFIRVLRIISKPVEIEITPATNPPAAPATNSQLEIRPSEFGWGETTNGLGSRIVAATNVFLAGQPIVMNLELQNLGGQARYFHRPPVPYFGSLQVMKQGGTVPGLVGRVQVASFETSLNPGASFAYEPFDLSQIYYLRAPGRYSVTFAGQKETPAQPSGFGHALSDLPPAAEFQFEVLPNPAATADGDPVARLLRLVNDPNIKVNLRLDALGSQPKFQNPGGNYGAITARRFLLEHLDTGSFLWLWLTDEPAAEQAGAKADLPKSEYLGQIAGWHVYLAMDAAAVKAWPAAKGLIKQALLTEPMPNLVASGRPVATSLVKPPVDPAEATPQATVANLDPDRRRRLVWTSDLIVVGEIVSTNVRFAYSRAPLTEFVSADATQLQFKINEVLKANTSVKGTLTINDERFSKPAWLQQFKKGDQWILFLNRNSAKDAWTTLPHNQNVYPASPALVAEWKRLISETQPAVSGGAQLAALVQKYLPGYHLHELPATSGDPQSPLLPQRQSWALTDPSGAAIDRGALMSAIPDVGPVSQGFGATDPDLLMKWLAPQHLVLTNAAQAEEIAKLVLALPSAQGERLLEHCSFQLERTADGWVEKSWPDTSPVAQSTNAPPELELVLRDGVLEHIRGLNWMASSLGEARNFYRHPPGAAVEGLSVRLGAQKEIWNVHESPQLRFDLRFEGTNEVLVPKQREYAELEVDGVSYRENSIMGQDVKPPEMPNLGLSLVAYWLDSAKKPLALAPGRHTLRLTIIAQEKVRGRTREIRAVSNPVEIEIAATTSPPAAPATSSQPEIRNSKFVPVQTGEWPESSAWDRSLPDLVMENVHLSELSLYGALSQAGHDHLFRTVLYSDQSLGSQVPFKFDRERATGREVLNALMATYTNFQYSQDQLTGVIWVYPEGVNYGQILTQKLKVEDGAWRVPMYSGVLHPMNFLLRPRPDAPLWKPAMGTGSDGYEYSVHLPAGVHSAREILNYCCTAEPNFSFDIKVDSLAAPTRAYISPNYNPNLTYPPPPRTGAVRFWELEIGRPTNGVPSLAELVAALGDGDHPWKRWAAGAYLRSMTMDSSDKDLTKVKQDPKAAWAAIAIANLRDPLITKDWFGRVEGFQPVFANEPGLDLLIRLRLEAERKEAAVGDGLALDELTSAQIQAVEPEVYGLATRSEFVRNKLIQLNSSLPELAPARLRELGHASFLSLAPAGNE